MKKAAHHTNFEHNLPFGMDPSGRPTTSHVKLFGHQRPLHSMFGGGKAADIILWKDKRLSAAILTGVTAFWFLFEVVEYNFVTLLCHSLIFTMLAIFAWYNGAELIHWNPPNIQEFRLSKSMWSSFFAKTNWLMLKFYDISSGKDMKLFFVTIAFLWILSTIGTYVSSLNFLYIGFLCMETLPVLYERYEKEVDYLARRGNQDVKELFRKFDSKVLNKIPRGPVKEKRLY
ncbi:reticulon-like protein B14 [Malania oleifera]|uniref:reticulon-like protein B14 n=1 Tax=Malania oleifera TaxID=397392 RepID=UPI0025ADE5AE|nr:reticulon-like protein B14 [Malania oleifera]